MKLRDLMSRDIHVVPPETSLRHAAQKMKGWDVGALPVCRNDELIGMITDRDITVRAVAEGKDPDASRVSDAMTGGLVYCYDDEDMDRAVELMEGKQIRRLPVLDRASKRLVGVVSLGDLATRQGNGQLSGEVLEQVSQPNRPHA